MGYGCAVGEQTGVQQSWALATSRDRWAMEEFGDCPGGHEEVRGVSSRPCWWPRADLAVRHQLPAAFIVRINPAFPPPFWLSGCGALSLRAFSARRASCTLQLMGAALRPGLCFCAETAARS